MTSKLGKAVRKQFDQALKERLPQFHLYHPPVPEPHSRIYRWEFARDLFFYVLVNFGSKPWEAFTIELAWTREPEWKPHTMSLDPQGDPKAGFTWFRICELIEKRPQFDPWWDFAPPNEDWADFSVRLPARLIFQGAPRSVIHDSDVQRDAFVVSALPLVPVAVNDAIEHVERYGLPYFDQIACASCQKDSSSQLSKKV